MGNDIFEVACDKGVRVRPKRCFNDLLQRSSIEECPRSTHSTGIMGTDRTDTKRVIPGEIDTLHKPTRNSVLGGSSMRSSKGHKEIRGGAKLLSTLEVPLQSSDRTPELILGDRGKGGQGRNEDFNWAWRGSLVLGDKGSTSGPGLGTRPYLRSPTSEPREAG